MVEITIAGDRIAFEVLGLDKLWALKGSLEIPLSHISGVHADKEIARGWWHGLRMPGTSLPGVIIAGTFYQHGRRVFYDVHDPDNTIVIELDHESYDQLIVEVQDPGAEISRISRAISTLGTQP